MDTATATATTRILGVSILTTVWAMATMAGDTATAAAGAVIIDFIQVGQADGMAATAGAEAGDGMAAPVGTEVADGGAEAMVLGRLDFGSRPTSGKQWPYSQVFGA